MTFLLWWLAVSLLCTGVFFLLVAVDDSELSDDYDPDWLDAELRDLIETYRK